MNWRNRKARIAIVLALAIFAAFYAWRMSSDKPPACVPGRHEVKDTSGKIIEIKRTECFRQAK